MPVKFCIWRWENWTINSLKLKKSRPTVYYVQIVTAFKLLKVFLCSDSFFFIRCRPSHLLPPLQIEVLLESSHHLLLAATILESFGLCCLLLLSRWLFFFFMLLFFLNLWPKNTAFLPILANHTFAHTVNTS